MDALCNPTGPYSILASRDRMRRVPSGAPCGGPPCSRRDDDTSWSIGSPLPGKSRARLPPRRRNKRMDQLADKLAELVVAESEQVDDGPDDIFEAWELLKRRRHPSRTIWDLDPGHWKTFNTCLPPGPGNIPGPPVKFVLPRPSRRPARVTKSHAKPQVVRPNPPPKPQAPLPGPPKRGCPESLLAGFDQISKQLKQEREREFIFLSPPKKGCPESLLAAFDKVSKQLKQEREQERIFLSPPKDLALQGGSPMSICAPSPGGNQVFYFGSPMDICKPTPRAPVARKDSVVEQVADYRHVKASSLSPPGGFLEELRAMGRYNGTYHISPSGGLRFHDI